MNKMKIFFGAILISVLYFVNFVNGNEQSSIVSLRQAIEDKLDANGHTCYNGCQCHTNNRGPSAYNPSYQYDCVQLSGCSNEGDLYCCKCKYKYYPPSVGESFGYNTLGCCAPPVSYFVYSLNLLSI